MPPIRGPAVPRRRLGTELRRLREEAGLLIEDVAQVLECSASKISRLENGKGIPKLRDVRDMLERYGVSDTRTRDRLLQWARDGQKQGWWQEFSSVIQQESMTATLDNYIALESDASQAFVYHSDLVPGLLQDRAYARAVIEVSPYGFSAEHVDRLVELRLRRQEVLHRAELPLEYTCVLDESVLLRAVGGRETMAAQLYKLMQEAALPNITVKILPLAAGEHPSMMSSFELFSFTDDTDHEVVNVETLTGLAYLEGENDIKRYRYTFQELSKMAHGPAESLDVIAAARRRMLADRSA